MEMQHRRNFQGPVSMNLGPRVLFAAYGGQGPESTYYQLWGRMGAIFAASIPDAAQGSGWPYFRPLKESLASIRYLHIACLQGSGRKPRGFRRSMSRRNRPIVGNRM